MVKNEGYQKGWNPSPLVKVDGKENYTATSNFAYTPEQVKQLSGLTAFNISQQASKDAILNAIAFKINQKAPNTIKVEAPENPGATTLPAATEEVSDESVPETEAGEAEVTE